MGIVSQNIDSPTNPVRFIDSGPIDGPLVVLLHGFPETAH
ncbi:hypothetical protein WAI88_19680, partial [Acinetobacter baumannii]